MYGMSCWDFIYFCQQLFDSDNFSDYFGGKPLKLCENKIDSAEVMCAD